MWKKLFISAALCCGVVGQAVAAPLAAIETTAGTFVVDLDAERAPKTVENFIAYAESGFYEGLIFHRVIKNFMVQGGGYTTDYRARETRDAIANEADNGLKNLKGTIAMARTSNPHSATAQFFINVKDNNFLDYRAPTRSGWGYTVFGKVVEGYNILDKMQNVATGAGGMFRTDVPRDAIIIKKVTITEPVPVEAAKAPVEAADADSTANDSNDAAASVDDENTEADVTDEAADANDAEAAAEDTGDNPIVDTKDAAEAITGTGEVLAPDAPSIADKAEPLPK